jgi:hypothetical protein
MSEAIAALLQAYLLLALIRRWLNTLGDTARNARRAGVAPSTIGISDWQFSASANGPSPAQNDSS